MNICSTPCFHVQQDDGSVLKSANPSTDDSTSSNVKPQFTLPLTADPVHAPLASPETLSMASGIIGGSLASGIVGGLSQSESVRDSLRRSFHSPPPHSSMLRSLSGPPARIEGVHTEVSPGKGEGHAMIGNSVEVNMPASLDYVQPSHRKVVTMDVPAYTHNVPSEADICARAEQQHVYSQSECKQTDPSVLPQQNSIQHVSKNTPAPEDLKEIIAAESKRTEAKFDSCESAVNNTNALTYSSSKATGGDKTRFSEAEACIRHSPVETSQGEYEHPNLHYSQASTGYPHGAYHPPVRFDLQENCVSMQDKDDGSGLTESEDSSVAYHPRALQQSSLTVSKAPTSSVDLTLYSAPHGANTTTTPTPHPFVHCQSESSIFAKHFPPKLGMKRSAEQTDICHLEDEAEVFPSGKDLFVIKRSAEQSDIIHLGDDLDVFEEETEDTVGQLSASRGRLVGTQGTPRSSTVGSVGQRQEGGSQHASSSHSSRSDEVFESEIAADFTSETDV